jgi:PKD repeat protein
MVSAPGVLLNDIDVDGDPLIATKLTDPVHGTVTVFNADGSFDYTPNFGFVGTDSFMYQIDDGYCTDTATVYITVDPPACVPEVWIDDNFGYSTPGFGIDHFVSIQTALEHLEPYGIAHINDGDYYENIIVDDGPWCDNTGILIEGSYGCFPVDQSAVIHGNFRIMVDSVTILNLEFTPNTDGSVIVDPDVDDTTLKCNKFRKDCESDAIGVYAHQGSAVQAELNWWGQPDGPTGGIMDDGKIAAGFGVEIIGEVYVEPWIGIHAEIAEPVGPIEVEVGTPVLFDGSESWAYSFGDCCIETLLHMQYEWDFDDGTYSHNKITTHVFDSPGTYEVSLMVDAPGIPGLYAYIMYDWDYVTVHVTQPETPLTVNADGRSLGGYETLVDEPIQLFGDAYGGDGTYQFSWNFGDNSPKSTEQNPTHIYDQPGTYTVTLTGFSGGETATDTAEVIVHDIDELMVTIHYNKDAVTNVETPFTTTVKGGTPPYSYNWQFGDGKSSIEMHPTHIYQHPGVYEITVTITDNKGKTDSDRVTVTVKDGVTPTTILEVAGGMFLTATIDAGSREASYQIIVEGNVFLGGEIQGTIDPGIIETVQLPLSFGFGKVTITITANNQVRILNAFLLGPFFMNIDEL